ncbi:hypothetical protein HMPREF0970_01842 [Schaalia odontolytica F0309]|uniref:Uncharacterized protein n=1 Tax=Schaalia odontolytica F0309 TaxID=649742 RepID=D4U0U8_9ACTO|nr:hypothetical protein HMPREF0970_01842 [Schaalia odontolytica F0309]
MYHERRESLILPLTLLEGSEAARLDSVGEAVNARCEHPVELGKDPGLTVRDRADCARLSFGCRGILTRALDYQKTVMYTRQCVTTKP